MRRFRRSDHPDQYRRETGLSEKLERVKGIEPSS